jgi:RNA-directed DNA polymerase
VVSVRRVTQVNRGQHTPGSAGALATTPDERATRVDDRRHEHPWQAAPVRRVDLPQAHGTPRPRGLPPRRDRVRPMVVNKALDPRFEAACAATSDGLRPGRCGQEARAAVDVARTTRAVGPNQDSLEAASQGACEPMRQDVSRPRLGPRPGRALVQHWRKAGAWEQGRRHHPTEGPPQGGVLRPLVATMARAGRAQRVGQGYRRAR